jgi:hypothetical protein
VQLPDALRQQVVTHDAAMEANQRQDGLQHLAEKRIRGTPAAVQ